MRILIALLLAIVFTAEVEAQRVCTPFTTVPESGMLPIGTVVEFTYYEKQGAVRKTGVVDEYYLSSCFPGVAIIGLDAQAYVIDYNSADGSRVVLNAGALTVK